MFDKENRLLLNIILNAVQALASQLSPEDKALLKKRTRRPRKTGRPKGRRAALPVVDQSEMMIAPQVPIAEADISLNCQVD